VTIHELTHPVQEIEHQAESGVMKAVWDARDYSQLAALPVPLPSEDVDLIQRAMRSRNAGAGK
jgi:hypothetical protein